MNQKCAIYLRISRDFTGEENAVTRQREDCQKIAADRGWEVFDEYMDNNISASDRRKDRPGYNRLVRDYEAGKFDALVCYDLDRLTRQPRQLEDWIDAAEERGLVLVTANGEADLSTDGGRMYARVKAAVARGEIERKGARQRRALQQRAEQGRPPLGVRLTGYTTGGEIVEDEAELVKFMFGQFEAGDSLKGICRALNEAGETTRRGRPWSPSTITTILRNPRYAGFVRYRGEVLADPGQWEPLVSEDTFKIVNDRLDDPGRRKQQGTDRKYLGSGVYWCECGKRARAFSGYRYTCADLHFSRSGGNVDAWLVGGTIPLLLDHERGIVVKDVEWDGLIIQRLARPDVADLLKKDKDHARAAELLADVRRLRRRLAATEEDYMNDRIGCRMYERKTRRIRAELDEAERERTALLADGAPSVVLADEDPVAAFKAAPLMIRRAVVDFLATVTLHPAKWRSRVFDPRTVEVDWKV